MGVFHVFKTLEMVIHGVKHNKRKLFLECILERAQRSWNVNAFLLLPFASH